VEVKMLVRYDKCWNEGTQKKYTMKLISLELS